MELKRQYLKAITTSICAGIFIIADKNTDNLYFRIYVVLFACIPFYYWIKYLKNYIDHKIDSSISSLKDQSEQREV